MNPWLLENLACPVDKTPLKLHQGLECSHGHRYPVVDGIPVLLIDGIEQTLDVAQQSLLQAAEPGSAQNDPLYLRSLGLSEQQRQQILQMPDSPIDPVVSYLVGATNGLAYVHLLGKLTRYPIPTLRLPPGEGKPLLDVGCNWGRWTLAAARKGYRSVGVDPSLGAVMAARRVARSLGLEAQFVVGDGRNLPFRDGCFDTVFSYSVIQHFTPPDAALSVSEMGRVLRAGGRSLVQMPTKWGVRCLYHQFRRRAQPYRKFDVTYYRVGELKRLFSRIGPTRLSVDCYFGIGLQPSDWALMPWKTRAAIGLSECIRLLSRLFAPLRWVADSVYLQSQRFS